MICHDHPKYTGKNKPRVDCAECWKVYEAFRAPVKWTKSHRADGRVEYGCGHGSFHGNHTHGGCDGCCRRDDYPLKNIEGPVVWRPGMTGMYDAVGNIILTCTECGALWTRQNMVNIWRDTYCPDCWKIHCREQQATVS